jgi:hypothetical protein
VYIFIIILFMEEILSSINMAKVEKARLKAKQQKKKNDEKEEDKICRKIIALNLLLSQLDITLDNVLNMYDGLYFRNTTISKKELFYQVINGTLTEENKKFLTAEGSKVNPHQNDKRTPGVYCMDLILGWLIEDAILSYIILKGIPGKLQGADCKRDFLKQNELDTTPDIIIDDDKNSKQLEVVCDWTDYWKRTGKADLRDNKFKRLVKEKSLLLGLSPISGTGFLINVADELHGFNYIQNISGYGNKSGYSTNEIQKYMKPIDEIFSELSNIFKN